ncbi:hypothetical protein BVY01_03215 [bacterium I07]|nr:hypothetical protein BVY01_03215 [bacterium I07]
MSITLKINGKEVKAKPGRTILEAAQKEGIYVPTLCHHPQLNPSGACRLCIVKVKGMKGLMTACTTPVEAGMEIRTETAQLKRLRRQTLELTLSEHPYTCLICDKKEGCGDFMGTIKKAGVITGCQYCPKSGTCDLQDLVDYLGLKDMPYPITYRSTPVEQDDPFFDRDYNLCIFCGRCVRMCNDVRDNGTLTFGYRGGKTVVGTAFGKSHMDVGCEFCGACVDVCPTGALYDKRSKWEGVCEKTVQSVCPVCSVGCKLDFSVHRNQLIATAPGHSKTHDGQACVRGRFGIVDLVHNQKRLKKPMIRTGKTWVESSWDEALDLVAAHLTEVKGSEFAMIASSQATNEDSYLYQKFTRAAMNSANIHNGSPLATPELVEALSGNHINRSLIPSMDEVRNAETLIIWGADLSVSHPVLGLRVKQAKKRGAKLIVVDMRKTKLAQKADLFLQVKPGTDRLVLAALLQQLALNLKKGKAANRKKILELTSLPSVSVKNLESKSGVARDQMLELVQILVSSQSTVLLYGSGILMQPRVLETIPALQNLAFTLSQIRMTPVMGESNLLGSLFMGCDPRVLPGLIPVNDEKTHSRIKKKWGNLPVPEGKSDLPGLIKKIELGRIKAMIVTDGFPALECLKKINFLVVQSVFPPACVEFADVILPAASISELNGSMVNFEGRIQRLRAASSPAGVKPDWWILTQIAKKMQRKGFDYRSELDVLREAGSFIKSTDLVKARAGSGSLLWGNGRTAGKKSGFNVFRTSLVPLKQTSGYTLRMFKEPGVYGYRGGSLIDLVGGMSDVAVAGRIEIHARDAKKHKLKHMNLVKIIQKSGLEQTARVLISDRVPETWVYWVADGSDPNLVQSIQPFHDEIKIEKVANE